MMSISNHLAQATSPRFVTWLLISCLYMSSAHGNHDGNILRKLELAHKEGTRPNVQMLIDLASSSTSQPVGGLQSGDLTCMRVITLSDSLEDTFEITDKTKFCSAFFKTQGSSKLTFEVSGLNLYSCGEETLYINDGATLESELCGDNTSVSSRSSRFLLVQYRRRTRTDTAFNFTVKAVSNEVTTTEMDNEKRVLEKSFSEGQICSGCGYSTRSRRRTRILGGSSARVTEHPWMVGLHIIRRHTDPKVQDIGPSCGASILDRRHVLTAAHCIVAESTHEHPFVSGLYVVAGSDLGHAKQESDPNAQKINVAHWYIHPSHNRDNDEGNSYDIAVLKLEEELEFNDRVGPVCLAAPLEFIGYDVTVTGYGHDPEVGNSADTLQAVKLTILSGDKCEAIYKIGRKNYEFKSHQVCLHSPSKSACGGDSGGPAVLKWENRVYQVAVVSFGSGCEKNIKDLYGGYTRVSSFIPWIKTVFQGITTC